MPADPVPDDNPLLPRALNDLEQRLLETWDEGEARAAESSSEAGDEEAAPPGEDQGDARPESEDEQAAQPDSSVQLERAEGDDESETAERAEKGDEPDAPERAEPSDTSVEDERAAPSDEPEPTERPSLLDRSFESEEDARTALQLYDWNANLSDQQRTVIDAVLNGAAVVIDARDTEAIDYLQRLQQQRASGAQANGSAVAPPTPAPDVTARPPDDAFDSPEAAAYVQNLESELNALKAQFQQTTTQSTQQHYQAQVAAGVEEFRAANPNLTADDYARLERTAADSGIFTGVVSQNPDVRAATRQALDYVLQIDPTLRDAQLEARMKADRDAILAAEEEDRVRRAKAATVSGSGATASRAVPAPSTPTEREQAMAAEIEQYLAQQAQ